METIEAVLSATGAGTVTAGAESVEVAPPGDVNAARHAILQAATETARERGEVCRLVIDDMGTRHTFALHPDGTREPIPDDGRPVVGKSRTQPAPATPDMPARSSWRREKSAGPAPLRAAAATRTGPIPPVPPIPLAPLLLSGPSSEQPPPAQPVTLPASPSPEAAPRPAPAVEIGRNPFVRAAQPVTQVEEIEPDPIIGTALEVEGLADPRLVRDVAPATPAPERPVITPESVWLVGASGGVGVSTLAALAGGRVIDGGVLPPHYGAPVWVVAATHPAGLEAAAEIARRNARGEITVEIIGLLLVHDRPKLSTATQRWARQITSVYKRSMFVPYMPAWREPGTPEVGNSVRLRMVLSALASKKRKKS